MVCSESGCPKSFVAELLWLRHLEASVPWWFWEYLQWFFVGQREIVPVSVLLKKSVNTTNSDLKLLFFPQANDCSQSIPHCYFYKKNWISKCTYTWFGVTHMKGIKSTVVCKCCTPSSLTHQLYNAFCYTHTFTMLHFVTYLHVQCTRTFALPWLYCIVPGGGVLKQSGIRFGTLLLVITSA